MATADGRNMNPVLRGVQQLSLDAGQKMQQRIVDELNSDIEDDIDSQEGKQYNTPQFCSVP